MIKINQIDTTHSFNNLRSQSEALKHDVIRLLEMLEVLKLMQLFSMIDPQEQALLSSLISQESCSQALPEHILMEAISRFKNFR